MAKKKMKMHPGMHEPWAREAGLYKGFTVWEEILGNKGKNHTWCKSTQNPPVDTRVSGGNRFVFQC